jgi:hypothetical protein
MADRLDGNQFHFNPASYLEKIREEVPAHDELQDAVAEATAGIQAERVLELGVGTGDTCRRVLDLHPRAELVDRRECRRCSLPRRYTPLICA